MRYLGCCLLFAATSAAAQTPSAQSGDKIVPQPITLTGCVAAGVESNTYVLSNVASDKPVGTTGSAAPDVFYWLDSRDKLKPHVGYQVQVTGMLDDDVDKTTVKSKDGKVELKSERTRKVEVPEGTQVASAMGRPGTTRTGYKVKVQSVTRLPGHCAQ
jgi:hypothetical protein